MRVTAGRTYLFHPVIMDVCDPPVGRPTAGQAVTVKNLPGCPKANTMGHCHIVDAGTGKFLGLVHVNSLVPA